MDEMTSNDITIKQALGEIGRDGRVTKEIPTAKSGEYEVYSRMRHHSEWFQGEGDAKERAKLLSEQEPRDEISVILHSSMSDLLVTYEAGRIKAERW